MAVTSSVYATVPQQLAEGTLGLATEPLRVMLCTSGYLHSPRHRVVADVTNEVTGVGYTQGGLAVTGTVLTVDATSHTRLHCDPVSWPASTITARWAIFYYARGFEGKDPAASVLLCAWNFGEDLSSSEGPFDLVPSTSGLVVVAT